MNAYKLTYVKSRFCESRQFFILPSTSVWHCVSCRERINSRSDLMLHWVHYLPWCPSAGRRRLHAKKYGAAWRRNGSLNYTLSFFPGLGLYSRVYTVQRRTTRNLANGWSFSCILLPSCFHLTSSHEGTFRKMKKLQRKLPSRTDRVHGGQKKILHLISQSTITKQTGFQPRYKVYQMSSPYCTLSF